MSNKTIILLAASLLATSALASEGTSDIKHSHKHHKGAVHHHQVAPVAAVEPAAQAKEHFAVIEGTYNFNVKKLKVVDQSSDVKRKVENSGSFGLGLGMNINENVSADATLSYVLPTKTKFSSDTGSLTVKTESYRLMFGGRYTFNDVISTGVSPFVTAGIGGSYNRTKVSSSTGNNFQFAYQVGAGLTVKASDDVNVDLAYRFSDNGKIKNIDSAFTGRNLQSHQVLLGLRVAF